MLTLLRTVAKNLWADPGSAVTGLAEKDTEIDRERRRNVDALITTATATTTTTITIITSNNINDLNYSSNNIVIT